MRPIISSILLLVSCLVAVADSIPAENFSYIPEINGTLRTRWEADLGSGESRFQVRNARISISGNIAPGISYFFQPDLCDRGKMKILDAYGQIEIINGLSFRAGQFRMPLGVESFRAPATYIFSNRSTVGRYICNYRAVGARVRYRLQAIPLMLEAGAFNPSSMSDHEVWSKSLAFGSKVQYYLGDWTFTTGFQSIKPSVVRINLVDASVGWHTTQWEVEGEYMYKHYTRHALPATHSWCIFGSYRFPIKAGIFNFMSVQGRWDGMTDNSDGLTSQPDGTITITDDARNRLTAGATISYRRTRVWLDLRLNYEKMFFHHTLTATPRRGDRLTAELVLHF